MINEHKIDWRQKTREDCINAILKQNNVSEETQEISDDDDDDVAEEEEGDVQEGNLSFAESLEMLDKMFFLLDDENHKMLTTISRKLENIQPVPSCCSLPCCSKGAYPGVGKFFSRRPTFRGHSFICADRLRKNGWSKPKCASDRVLYVFYYLNRTCSFHFKCVSIKSFYNKPFVV